ncbi:hypothetical protein NG791_25925 [Laspinema sp. D1]|uniref:hypothetical protein n=1 Tax=Laspinema palackyanum TaxID=3231601 RepID=UPI003491CBB9|nr:hypothetical protein [Laspinema sp. D2b]
MNRSWRSHYSLSRIHEVAAMEEIGNNHWRGDRPFNPCSQSVGDSSYPGLRFQYFL